MSSHVVNHVNTRVRGEPWTEEQSELLEINWRKMSDKALAVFLSCNGPARTESAVSDRRSLMGLKRASGYDRHSEHGRAGAQHLSGWPCVLGPEEHLKRLYAGLQAGRAA